VFDPGSVRDDWKFDGRKEIGSKASVFVFIPCESCFMIANEIVHKASFFGP
jgi:hypothetical protein